MFLLIVIAILIFVLCLIFASLQKNPETNITNAFWQKFETMFIESKEDMLWSANRFAYVFTMVISNIILWGTVLYLVILNHEFPNIPESIIAIYGISNGVASMAKVWQKREERLLEQLSNPKPPDETKK